MDSLVEDGDEIVAVRVIELDEGGEGLLPCTMAEIAL